MEKFEKGSLISNLLKDVNHLFKQGMHDVFVNSELTVPQFGVVKLLKERGEAKISEISEVLYLSDSTVSGIIDRLEDRGFVERIRSKEDRRVVNVRLTDKAHTFGKEIHTKVIENMERLLKDADEAELQKVIDGLETLKIIFQKNN